jgi:3-oxoacyl-[acyl-carrier-protein] synthase II
MRLPRLALTGLGTVSPLGESAAELLEALDAGRHGLVPVSTPLVAEAGWAGRVTRFDPSPVVPPMRARRLDRASLYAVVATSRALADAGLTGAAHLTDELGLVLGTSSAGSGPLTVFLEALLRQGPQNAPPVEFPNTVANAPAGHVSIELGLRGPNATLAHSEAVVGVALQTGRLMLASERCALLGVGAVDEWNPYYQLGYRQIGGLRAAATGGGGTLLSEGATILVAEPAPQAAARGARVLATLLGVGVTSATIEPYRWGPDPAAIERAIRLALDDAELDTDAIGSLVLAANGVEAMEEAEAVALGRVFGTRALASTGLKGAVGERATSGVLSVAVAALARHRGALPPYAGGALARWPVPVALATQVTPMPAGATLVVLYGFGGNYAAVVVGD